MRERAALDRRQLQDQRSPRQREHRPGTRATVRIDRSGGNGDAGEHAGVTTIMIRILLVDDHPVARQGIRTVLTDRVKDAVVGEAARRDQRAEQVRQANGIFVIADISLPGMSGLELLKELKRLQPACQRSCSACIRRRSSHAARSAPARSAISPRTATPRNSSRRSMRRGAGAGTSDATRPTASSGQPSDGILRHTKSLSDREYQVLRMLGSGRTISDIGRDLV